VAVRPELVCEVAFDHLQGNRFRHASRFLRWRPDKGAAECGYDQLLPPHLFDLRSIVNVGG
jgi:ATP-dependent DNA ligase